MSSSFYLHVGPYLYCSSATKPRTEERRVCSKSKKHHLGSDVNVKMKFCPECAAPVASATVKIPGKTSAIDPEDVEDAIGVDVLHLFNTEYTKEGVDLYVPNEDREAPREFGISGDGDEGDIGEILDATETPHMIDRECDWLATTFGKEIDALMKLYGQENVVIKWGVLGEFR